MRCNNLAAEIQHRGYQYTCMRKGRGITHERAFRSGAMLVINLIKEGAVSLDEIKSL